MRASHPLSTGGTALWLCALLAIALHGAVLFVWKIVPVESPASMFEGESVEVALVESAPSEIAAVAEPQPVTPAVVPPEPVPPPIRCRKRNRR